MLTNRSAAAETPEERRTELLAQATTALRKGRPLDAIMRWRAAWAIRQSYDVACNIGKAEARHGSAREGAEFLAICLREHPTTTTSDKERLESFKQDLDSARKQTGALTVLVDQPGAEVSVDGHVVGRSPLPELFVKAGTHTVGAELEGHVRADAVVTLERGDARTVSLAMAPLRPKPRSAPLAPTATPSASAPGLSVFSLPVAASGVGLTTLGAGLGIGFTVASTSASASAGLTRQQVRWQYQIDCDSANRVGLCSEYSRDEQAKRSFARAAAASFVGAGVFATATVLYFAFPRSFPRPLKSSSSSTLVVYQW